ncbi:MAG: hypothetical protein NV1_31 [Nanoarchaeotal virus 1]|nr:MAG: hypothetical protein NV1_31 [Nanoarchaeotal virus 1]
MNEEPPYGTTAWYFFEIEEKERQLSFLLSDIEEKIAKVKNLLNEMDILKAQLETNINVGKI